MAEPPEAGYVVCPDCGAGWGKPHFERCLIPVPFYSRRLGAYQVQGLLAYALAVFPLTDVRRSTVRAMLPRGERTRRPSQADVPGSKGRTRNRVSDTYGIALQQFEERGWIWRTPEQIRVFDRPALLRQAKRCLPNCWWLTEGVHEAIAALAADFPPAARAGEEEQRNRELAALRALMQQAPGTGPHAGRGYVRIVPRPPQL